MKATITKETVEKARTLNEKGVDVQTISRVLNISHQSAHRIIAAIKAGKIGDSELLNSLFGIGNYTKLKNIVCEIYGLEIDTEKNTEKNTEKIIQSRDDQAADNYNNAFSIVEIKRLLEYQNKLLERFCAAFGVETGGIK